MPAPKPRASKSIPRSTVTDIALRAGVSHGIVSRALNNRPGIGEDTRARVIQAASELGYDHTNLRSDENRVGVSEVAQLAEVSIGSVSRALKGQSGVSAQTRERVLRAAESLGYDAQNLRPSVISRIGFLIHRGPNARSTNTFYPPVLHGAAEACRERRIRISYLTIGPEDDVADLISHQEVDGLLCIGYFEPELLGRIRQTNTPIVLVDHFDPKLSSVNSDNYHGARQVVSHLIQGGRHRIGFIAGPLEHHSIAERHRGYRAALAYAGLGHDPKLEVIYPLEGDHVTLDRRVKRVVKTLLARAAPPDAIFAFNDDTASATIQTCQAMGLRVPEDIAIAGFDDVPTAAYLNPTLTTVAVPKEELGIKGVELLLRANEQNEITHLVVPTALIVRESSSGDPRDD